MSDLSAWILSVEGTETGRQAALILALVAAVAHASLGAMQKGRFDPWLSRGAIDLWVGALSLPLAIFVVPFPGNDLLVLFPGMMVIHLAYKWVLAMAYTRGAFTAVYPVVRGTGPLATVLFAGLVFGEFFTPGQWTGVAILCGGIFALAGFNLANEKIDPATLRMALALAVLTGLITAVYTVYDAFAIRTAVDPLTFIVWFFLLEAVLFPALLWNRWRVAGPALRPLFIRGFFGAFIAYISFASIFLATRLDKVGEAAALRETSVIFAALIGWLILGEKIGLIRAFLMVVIAAGAVLVEFG
ncbi:MAG: DMT family transporter [Pseudomonadota bacterium]